MTVTRLALLAGTAKAAAYYGGLILAARVEDRRLDHVTVLDRIERWHACRVRAARGTQA